MEKQIEFEEFKKLRNVLNTIMEETIPLPNHSAPGTIKDCWNQALEIIKKIECRNNNSVEVE